VNDKSNIDFVEPLLALIKQHQSQCNNPCFVALDGRSGSGKSTLAAHVTNCIASVSVIAGDEFYTGGSSEIWSSRTANENAQKCIDWKKQHAVISALKSKGYASWHAFDWHSEQWDSNKAPLCPTPSTCSIAEVVLLEGVNSDRSELASLFDLRVVLHVPSQICEKRLIAREGDNLRAEWERLWSAAEQQYLDNVLDYTGIEIIKMR